VKRKLSRKIVQDKFYKWGGESISYDDLKNGGKLNKK